ncbi:MAG: hypothetical protein CMJ67_10140 [Planctomycetaceae bacterium]|nr:hypothetical protein [Planctomycetaceae bacterium]
MADQAHLKHIKDTVDRVKGKMRITKVVATRAVKTKQGDFFAGMSAAWDTVQDDAGGMGADTDISTDTADSAASGMTLVEAQVAHILLSMEASIGAHRAALSDGAISESRFDDKVKHLKRNALAHLSRILPKPEAQAMVDSAAQVA